MDWIELTESRVDAIVGILPRERVTPQPMLLDVRIEIDLEPIGESGDLSVGLDYAAVEADLHFLARAGKFWLIETYALAAVRWLLLTPEPPDGREPVTSAQIRVRKPEILDGRSIPGVHVSRVGPLQVRRETRGKVSVGLLAATDKDGAWRVRMPSGAHWDAGPHQAIRVVRGSVNAAGALREPGAEVLADVGRVEAVDGPVTLLVAGIPVTNRPLGA